MRLIFFVCLAAFALPTSGQVSLTQYFDYDLVPKADFLKYKDIDVQWNFDGKTQREFNSGLTFLKEDRYPQAIAAFEEAIKLSPDVWVSYYYRGICFKITDKLDEALTDLEFAQKKSGGKYEISYEIAEIYQYRLEYAKAAKYYDECRDLSPEKVEGYYGIANIAFLTGDTDRAVRFYKKCIEVDPSFPDAYLKTGLLKLFVDRRESKAFEYLDKAVAVAPTFEDGLYWRGLINIEFNNTGKALEDWNALIRLNPNRPFYTLIRGYLYIELNDFDKAFIDLKNSVIAFDIDENKFKLGSNNLNKQLDLQSASHYLMRTIYGLDDFAALPLKKAYCLMVKRSYESALKQLDASIRFQPSAAAYFLKATAFEYLLNHDSAFSNLDKTLKLDNDIFDAHKKRAIYRTSIKDWRGATYDFMQMERVQPASIITYKLRAQLKSNLKDYYGTIVDATRYLKSDSTNLEMWKLRANAQLQVKNYPGYKEDFSRIVRLDTSKLEHYQGLYVANMLLADTVEAQNVLALAANKFPRHAFPILQQMEIHLWKKDFGRALFSYQLFEKLPFKPPEFRSEALYLKGLAHVGRAEHELAISAFSLAIAEGKIVGFVNLDAHYERGKLSWKIGKPRQTKSDFKILKANNYSKDVELVNSVLNAE